MEKSSVNFFGLPRGDLEKMFADLGERPFRARQIMQWIYRRSVMDFDAMTDLSLGLRQTLADRFAMDMPRLLARQQAADGVIKWRLDAGRGQAIETVFIPEVSRGTLCVSSQVGCAMDCPFCSTGRQGFNRNLTTAEIVGQVQFARKEGAEISNVVFMGMGEPLANLDAVVRAADIFLDDLGFGLSRRRVTVSTSGLVPQIRRLGERSGVALAVSLHAPDDDLRDKLVPINRRHPIGELLEACWAYAEDVNLRDVTFEYVMLDGVNDGPAQARALARLLADRPAKVNLIPFNDFPGSGFRRSPPGAVDRFRDVLVNSGIVTITRKTRGSDIDAACGQLAGRVDNLVRSPLGAKMNRSYLQ